MKASKWFKPYQVKKGVKGKLVRKTNLNIPYLGIAGAYIIKHIPSGKIVYVGKSHTQLKDTIYRHFRKWKRPKNNPGNFGYKHYGNPNAYAIRVFITTAAQADRLELYWIKKYRPLHNSEKLADLFSEQPATIQQQTIKDHQAALKAATEPVDLEEPPF